MPSLPASQESPELILNAIGRRELIQYFERRLKTEVPLPNRLEMIHAYATLAGQDALDLLACIAANDREEAGVRSTAIREVARIFGNSPPQAEVLRGLVPMLRRLLKHESEEMHSSAAIALSRAGEIDTVIAAMEKDPKLHFTAEAEAELIKAGLLAKRRKRSTRKARRTPQFVRRSDLEILEKAFKKNSIVSLVGAPGTGKTSLAVQFAQKAGYHPTIWMSSPTSRSELLSKISESLDIKNAGEEFTRITQVLRSSRTLIVIDDFDQVPPDVVSPLKEMAAARTHILLISRSPAFDGATVRLGGLTQREAEELIKWELSSATNYFNRDVLAKTLEYSRGNPVLLQRLLRFIKQGAKTGDLETALSLTARDLFEGEIRRLDPREQRALQLLAYCGDRVLLTRAVIEEIAGAELMCDSVAEVRDVLGRLSKRGLVTEKDNEFAVAHASLRAAVQALTDQRTASRLKHRFAEYLGERAVEPGE